MSCLTLADLQELKSFNRPPETVKVVLYALFGEEESWINAKKFLGNRSNIISKMSSFDISSITPARAKRMELYFNHPSLSPDSICMASRAAYDLWQWLLVVYEDYQAMGGYVNFAPKKKKKKKKFTRKKQTKQSLSQSVEIPHVFQEAGCKRDTNDVVIIDAIRGLQLLTKNALTEMRSFNNPPELVKLVCFAVLSLFGEATTWPNAKHFFSKRDLMHSLLSFDANTLTSARAKRVRAYVINDVMTMDAIKRTSTAALCLWEWVIAVYNNYLARGPTRRPVRGGAGGGGGAVRRGKAPSGGVTLSRRSTPSVSRRSAAPFPLAASRSASISTATGNIATPTVVKRSRIKVFKKVKQHQTDSICGRSLNPNALIELKSFQNPPEVVKLVCFAMLALFGEDTSWPSATQFLSKRDLMHRLLSFDVNCITLARAKRVRAYVDNDVMTVELIEKTSKAALCLWEWVTAVYNMYKMNRQRSVHMF